MDGLTQSPVEQQQPINARPFLSQKFSWKLVIFLIVVSTFISSSIVYSLVKRESNQKTQQTSLPSPAAQPTSAQDETVNTEASRSANWKTYANIDGKYSLQYPPSWQFQNWQYGVGSSNFENKPYVEKNYNPYYRDPSRVYGEVLFGSDKVTEGVLLNPKSSFWKVSTSEVSQVCQGPANLVYYQEASEVRVGNIRTMVQLSHPLCNYESTRTSDMTKTYYMLRPSDSSLVKISFHYDDTYSGKDNLLKLFNQILSTFKFLPDSPAGGDQEQTIDTSNWKTYVQKELGYSVHYPPDWEVQDKSFIIPKEGTIILEIEENKENLSLSSWVAKNVIEPAEDYKKKNYDAGLDEIRQNKAMVGGKEIITVSGIIYDPRADTELWAYVSLGIK